MLAINKGSRDKAWVKHMKLFRIILVILSIPILFLYLLPLVIILEIKNAIRPSLEQACKNNELGLAIREKYKNFIDWKF